jgi:hypothetical protein
VSAFLNTRALAQLLVIGLLVVGLSLIFPMRASADTSPAAYLQAVEDTLVLVQGRLPNDTASAQQALGVLEAGTGNSQREIIADLESSPPDYEDATTRLLALRDALKNPANTSDPAQAQQRLHDVLAMRRYDALHKPQTWIDRLRQWINDRINDVLSAFRRQAGSLPLPSWVFYLLGGIVVALLALLVFSSARGRFTEGSLAGGPSGPRAPADYFDEADRLAAAGDRVGAIRALCAGVAATLAGERTWEGSPLTVREIFQHAPDPASLRQLLSPFEAAVYGGRAVDKATYERAVHVAAPFRQPKELAA